MGLRTVDGTVSVVPVDSKRRGWCCGALMLEGGDRI